jgi:DNA-directed RNA polymerase subunit alpha
LLELLKEPGGEEQPCHEEDNDIDTWGLSVRTYNCLKRAGYNNQHDFEGKHIADISSLRGMQEKSLQEILQKLKARGLELD